MRWEKNPLKRNSFWFFDVNSNLYLIKFGKFLKDSGLM